MAANPESLSPREEDARLNPDRALRQILRDQLENAVDAVEKGLGTYESLRNLSEVIGGEYGDRVIFELIQNAHDAHRSGHDGRILLRLHIRGDADGDLYVANGGDGFDWANVNAIRNVGMSSKTVGEGIGNKGLGFRSVETLTDDPRIYSQACAERRATFSGFCFRFANYEEVLTEVSAVAESHVAIQVAKTLPRYLAALPITEQPPEIAAFAREGFATVVHVPLATEASVSTARKQVLGLLGGEAPLLLFLDRLRSVVVEIVDRGKTTRKTLSRELQEKIHPLDTSNSEYEIIQIQPGGARYLVARRSIDRQRLLDAIERSIPLEPQLVRWREWRGEPKVAVAVPIDKAEAEQGRIYNFLPMAVQMPAPIRGHVDAPFYASIDRRRANFELPLNSFLLDAIAQTAAVAAYELRNSTPKIGRRAIFDLAAWEASDWRRAASTWRALGHDWSKVAIVPSAGGEDWTSIIQAWSWEETGYRLFRARRLVKSGVTNLADPDLGSDRLARLAELTRAAGGSPTPGADTLAKWTGQVAASLLAEKASPKTWATFYDEIRRSFQGTYALQKLRDERFLRGRDGKLHAAGDVGGGATVFVRQDGVSRRRDRERAPLPPPVLTRRLAIFDESIALKPETISDFVKAGLVRRYDALELLEGLPQLFGDHPAPARRAAALKWAFDVWRAEGPRAEKVLPRVDLHVETRGGWRSADRSFFSGAWTADGRKLATYLAEGGPVSEDCRHAADYLLLDEPDWAPHYEGGRREWTAFLRAAGVRDGLPLIADEEAIRSGTPWNDWNYFLRRTSKQTGRDEGWVELNSSIHLKNPMTNYERRGELWRLPGQLEYEQLPPEARERLADLILVMLRQGSVDWRYWHLGRYDRWEGEWNEVRPYTPAGAFLENGAWMPVDGSEDQFRSLHELWATTNNNARVPRYVPRPRDRLADLIQSHDGLTDLLVGGERGLRDWSSEQEAARRLADLAAGASNLDSRERAQFRRTYERAWSSAVEAEAELPADLPVAVWHGAGLDVIRGSESNPQKLFVAADAQRAESRAVVAAGLPLLELGREEDIEPALSLLATAGGFDAVRVEGGEVTVYVNGEPFVPSIADPLLASGGLEWLSDAALLANEVLGRELERAISMAAVEDRLRRVRLRLCSTLSLRVGASQGAETLRFYAYPDDELPTLVAAGAQELDWGLLAEAAPHLASLLDRRMRSLQRLLPLLAVRSLTSDPHNRPSDESFARALDCRPELVRELLEGKGTDQDFLLKRLPPLIACFIEETAARALAEGWSDGITRTRVVDDLGDWKDRLPLAPDLIVDLVLEVRDMAEVRRRLNIDFAQLNRMLLAFAQEPLSNEPELRRLFETWKDELRPEALDRLRRHFFNDYTAGGSLDKYVALRSLEFAEFPTEWVLDREEVSREDVSNLIHSRLDAAIGADVARELEPIGSVRTKIAKILRPFLERALPIISAWCARNEMVDETWSAGSQAVLTTLEQRGLLDFEPVKPGDEISFLDQHHLWPDSMPATLELDELGLTTEDLDVEKKREEERKEAAAKQRRSFDFAGEQLDTAAGDFAAKLIALADAAMTDDDWLRRSRRRFRLTEMPQGSGSSGGSGGRGGKRKRTQRLSDDVKAAMGFAGEFLASRYLAAKHPQRFDEQCWVSSNREFAYAGSLGNDDLGFDFRVRTKEVEWRYEVKASTDDSFEFEFTQNEMRVAAECAADGARRYRILYVPFVNDPSRWRVMELPNPMSEDARSFYRAVGASSTRMRFDPTG